MKAKALFTILISMVTSLFVYSQEMQQAHKNIMQFEGKWKSTDIQLTLGDKTYGGVYTFDCVAVNGNTGILAHEKFESPELGTLLSVNLVGYDPHLQQVHIYTIDNMGTAHDHSGYWVDDNYLYVQYQGVAEGKMHVEQIDMKFQGHDKMKLKLTAMMNGEVLQQVSATFVKASETAISKSGN
jgi:hypothetical protein